MPIQTIRAAAARAPRVFEGGMAAPPLARDVERSGQ